MPDPLPPLTQSDWLALFGCGQADLKANRAGRLSPGQAKLATRATFGDATFMLGVSIVAWLVMGGVFGIFQSSPHAFVWETLDLTGVGLLTLIFALPVSASLWTVWCFVVYFRSRDATRVETREGPVEKRRIRYERTVVCSIVVANEKLDVSDRVFADVREGERLRVYYVGASRVVVMLEPTG